MKLHDLTLPGRTMAAPVCTDIHPRKEVGSIYAWSVVLVWDVDPADVPKVSWPSWVSDSDRTKILRACAPDGVATKIQVDPHEDVEVDIHCLVNGLEAEALKAAPALVKRQEVMASEKSCRVRALLVLSLPASVSSNVLSLLDADVVVTIRATGDLFDSEPELEPEPPEPEPEPQPKTKRSRKATQLPPEA